MKRKCVTAVVALCLVAALASASSAQLYYYALNPIPNLPPVVYAGPQWTSLDVAAVTRIDTVGSARRVNLRTTSGSTVRLDLEPGSSAYYFFVYPVSTIGRDVFETVLREAGLRSSAYRIRVENVWTYPAREFGVYKATTQTVIRVEAESVHTADSGGLVSASFNDNASSDYYGTLVLRTSSDRNYPLLKKDVVVAHRGDLNDLRDLDAIPPTNVPHFGVLNLIGSALAQEYISISNHTTDGGGNRIVHNGSWW